MTLKIKYSQNKILKKSKVNIKTSKQSIVNMKNMLKRESIANSNSLKNKVSINHKKYSQWSHFVQEN